MAANSNDISNDAAAALRASAWDKGVLSQRYETVAFDKNGNAPASEQELRAQATRMAGEKRLEEFQAEQSENAAGRILKHEHFSRGAQAAQVEGRKRQSENGQMFYLAAAAAAYDQPITLDFGNGPTATTPGEVRDEASELYNEYAEKYHRLIREGASQEEITRAKDKMDYYQNVMDVADDVAAGRKPPEAMQTAVDADQGGKAELGKSLDNVENARSAYNATKAQEAENAGTLEELSAEQQDDASMAAFFGTADGNPAPSDEQQTESTPENAAPDFDDIDFAAVTPPPPSGPGF
ncbi:hypothetical protein KAJ83_04445 [Marivibrio halodurans]|uniref:Uncharacterized protein n=1 Tax=Marivibrio halodurans TaxID=2039722 RepID=A0A8J7RWX1_9PROT|nr:hypothetical protein [Marivibrio halodurans]MBP5856247.1 hypothetical protein [Marivibrio halodurans]